MAFLQVNFVSAALFRTVPMNVILPTDKIFEGGYREKQKPFKTLYLLHGILGNYTDWINHTRIQEWAEERNLAVVMPSGDNSFYVDNPVSQNGEFIGQELLAATRAMFPLSHKREDTFIAGLSMGGFGALRNGLVYHRNFGYIAGLSSAIHLFEQPFDAEGRNIGSEDAAFGSMKEAIKTDKNPRVAFQNLLKEKEKDPSVKFPKIYMACGTEDPLIVPNRAYKKMFEDAGVDLVYEEGPGVHNWDFWNEYIFHVLNWLPLETISSGINSGNVKSIND